MAGGGGHKSSAGHSQSALCKQASCPGVDRLQGGVLHGPLGLSAEQITDNWQECGICSQKEGERQQEREGAKGEEFSWWQKAGPPINIYLMHSYSRASGPCSCISAGRQLPASLATYASHRDLHNSLGCAAER